MRARILLAIALVCASCDFPEQAEIDLPTRDVATFQANVQPFIGPGCGSLDCHGDPGRGLALYSYYGLRKSKTRRLAVNADELARNVAAFAAMPVDRLLGKPLSAHAGGMRHVGGELWASVEAPEYVCLKAWLAGQEAPQPCTDAIARAPY